MPVAGGRVVGAPVGHPVVDGGEGALAGQARDEEGRRPGRVGAVDDLVAHVVGQLHGPALGDLEDRPLAGHEVQAGRGDGHAAGGGEVRGEAASGEVLAGGGVEGGGLQIRLDVRLGDLPPVLDDGVALGVLLLTGGVERGGPGVAQVDEAVLGASLELVTGDPLNGLGAPVGAHVTEELRTVGQDGVEEHGHGVAGVALRGEDLLGPLAVPVEGGVEEGLEDVAVGLVVRPLTLPLEARRDGVVALGLLDEAQLGQGGVALHEVAADEEHLDAVVELLVVLLLGEAVGLGVAVLPDGEVLPGPGQGGLVLLVVVDAVRDTAVDLDHVDVLGAHAQVVDEELLGDAAAGDPHGDGPDREVAAPLHEADPQGGAHVAQDVLDDVVGQARVVGVLHVVAVDAEAGDAQHVVGGGRGGQGHGPGALSAVEAPDGVRDGGVEVEDLGDVVPGGGDGQVGTHVLGAELLLAAVGLGHAPDRGLGDDAAHRAAVGVSQARGDELGDILGQLSGLVLEGLPHATTTSVNEGTDSDGGVGRSGHGKFPFTGRR